MQTFITLFGVMFALALGSVAVFGCECPGKRGLEQEMAISDLVFSGEVTRISIGEREREIEFRPNSVWKGPKTESVVVRTTNPGAACGFDFKQGRNYLVFASFEGAILRTSSCTRTKPAEYAYDDFEKLLDHGWSQPVNGLRARISLLPDTHGESPIFKVFIEMQNVVNIMGQRTIRFSPSRLELRVVDPAGGEVTAVEPTYNGLSPNWKDTILPHGGTIKFNATYPGAGYLRPSFMAIDLGPSRIWPLALDGTYFVSGKLVIPPQKGDHPFLDWSGTIEMPMVIVRAAPRRSAL